MTLTLRSPAKINWYLHVGAVRPDGFHTLETIYQEIALADMMHFQRIDEDECRLTGFPVDIDPETNLVSRAWNLMKQHYGSAIGGLSVAIEKCLPRGGGLGGGSSNAGTTLRAIDELYSLHAGTQKLEEIGAQLGSDVPFFIRGGTAGGVGRGEIIEPLPSPDKCWLVLYFPSESMPTGEAYKRLDEIESRSPSPLSYKQCIKMLQIPLLESITQLIYNDFEMVTNEAGWYLQAKRLLENAGCIKVFLCGSGSTVAGIARNSTHAEAITRQIGRKCTYTYTMTF